MDFLRSFKIFLVLGSLTIELSLCIPWYKDVGQGNMLNSLNSPYLSAAYDSFYGERERLPKSISKRSADWSNRRNSVTSAQLLPEPQESENIEMTTKLPKVIRKIRLQNVPPQFKHFDQNGISLEQSNSTVTSDKRGRVVRVKKFRRRTTTPKPISTTTSTRRTTTSTKATTTSTKAPTTSTRATTTSTRATTTSTRATTTSTRATTMKPTTIRPLSFVRQTTSRTRTSPSQYSHITVINKEYVHQKPNRKNRNKNMNRIWVPTSTSRSRTVQKESNDVTSQPYPSESEIKKQRSESFYDDYQTRNKGFGAYELNSDSSQRSRSNRQITNQDKGSKLETARLTEPTTRRTVSEKKQKSSHLQTNVNPSTNRENSEEMEEKNSHQTSNPNSGSDTTPMPPVLPKSVEILKDDPLPQNNPGSHNIPQPSLRTNDTHFRGIPQDVSLPFGSELPSHPQMNSQPEQIIPDTQFRHFPPQQSSVFQGYPYDNINPYFRSPQPQIPGMPPIQKNSPLMPTNFRQPFTPFNRQNDPQFQDYFSSQFQSSPYRRREGLARPDFYQSPQLASLRRSIIEEAFSEEEVTEPTTEFSIPKFEIPSIDFNDKGCRTVYKEVKAVPSDELNEGTQESNAKSFVMTRECYFPDGVPTIKPTIKEETTENVTSPTKEI